MRRACVLSVVAVLLLTACGRSDDAAEPAASASSGAPIVVVGSFAESGPLAATGALGDGVGSYLAKINADGGVAGREITYIQYDDGYDPSRLAANARRAVEQDKASIFLSFGGPSLSVRPYLHQHSVMHVVLAGNTPFSEVDKFPFSHAWWPDLAWESAINAAFLKLADPQVKLGVLGFNNDLTDSQAAGLAAGGIEPTLVLKVPPPQLDTSSQVTQLRAAGVNAVLLSVSAGQVVSTVRYMNQIGYQPTTFIYSASAGFTSTIRPLADAAKGIHSTAWMADPADPRWSDDADLIAYRQDMDRYGRGNPDDNLTLNGYAAAAAVVNAIRTADGSDSKAYNDAWNATKDLRVPGLLPGITLNAGPSGRLVHTYQIVEFDGASWTPVGPVRDAAALGYTE